jgi:glutamate N-acetyltransferase/amino-acid N-acetyltransferase
MKAIFHNVRRSSTVAGSFPKPHLIPKAGTYPKDFVAGGVAAGVKKKAGVLDMTMVYSKKPCSAAAVFTKNAFAAAPVQVGRHNTSPCLLMSLRSATT